MTAFIPIPAREAAELVEAAGIPEGRRVLIDSAEAGLVDAYALATNTETAPDVWKHVRAPAIGVDLWRRIVRSDVADDLWSGGTVRVAGNGLIGGPPAVYVTGIGFGEASLRALIAHHVRQPGVTAKTTKPVRPPDDVTQPATPATVVVPASKRPAPPKQPSRRGAGISGIPAGAITVTVEEAMAIIGLGRTKINELMIDGRLERRKVDTRTLITVASIRSLLGQDPTHEA